VAISGWLVGWSVGRLVGWFDGRREGLTSLHFSAGRSRAVVVVFDGSFSVVFVFVGCWFAAFVAAGWLGK